MTDNKIKFLEAQLSLMNKILYDKYIANWYSSSMKLECDLKKHGIKLPKKLYYDYKFPNGKKNFEYHDEKHEKWQFVVWYDDYINSNRTIHGALLSKMDVSEPEYDLGNFFRFCINLALANKQELQKFFAEKYAEFNNELQKDIQEIRKLNPELKIVKKYDNVHFLCGCMYGFSPDDIEYFTRFDDYRKRDETDLERLNYKLYQLKGSHSGYVLSPSNCKMIEQAVDAHLALLNKQSQQKI